MSTNNYTKLSSVIVKPRTERGPASMSHLGWELWIDHEFNGYFASQDEANNMGMALTGLFG
jgi:hypothetical protein